MLLGHAHPAVVDAITRQAARGTAFGAPTALEVEMAERIHALVPSIEMVRMVNSGTEATMARGAPGARRHGPAAQSSSSKAAITDTATASS